MNFRHLVVHCKKDPYDVYIGRRSKSAPKGASCDWGNPFVMKNQSRKERERVCREYRNWFLSQPNLVNRARSELKGKVLGCYCSPKDCHGHFLAEIANSEDSTLTHGDSKSSTDEATESIPSHRVIIKNSHGNKECSLSPTFTCEKLADTSLTQNKSNEGTSPLVDIGINVHNKYMLRTWSQQIIRASEANVNTILLTGTSMQSSSNSLDLANKFSTEKAPDMNMSLYCTVGIHPHSAKTFRGEETLKELRSLLNHPLAVAVGECGLDYNRNFSTPTQQLLCFEEHVKLACDMKMPLFVHEREAHDDLVSVLKKFADKLPPVVIHCFTGTASEAQAYIDMGFYIGFTGTICKYERGRHLRDLLPNIPLCKIMLETDAPFMGFVKGRRESEPKDVVGVAMKVAEVLNIEVDEIRRITTTNAKAFFNI